MLAPGNERIGIERPDAECHVHCVFRLRCILKAFFSGKVSPNVLIGALTARQNESYAEQV